MSACAPLDLGAPGGPGVFEVDLACRPDSRGVLASCPLRIPEFDRACYWAPFQRHNLGGPLPHYWPDGANRLQPLAVDDLSTLAPGGAMLLLRLRHGEFLAVLPIAGPETMAWLASRDGAPVLEAGTLGTEAIRARVPLAALASGDTPYAACRAAWDAACGHPVLKGRIRPRESKPYPAMYEFLGWCTWEQFRREIDEARLLAAADAIEASGLPIRWMLIDDGHARLDEDERLTSFRPNDRFPNGWAPLTARKSDRLRWMGLWLNYNGHFRGVSPENELGRLNESLRSVDVDAAPPHHGAPGGADTFPTLAPRGDPAAAAAFHRAHLSPARRAGFDFVKVDNQARNLGFLTGSGNPVRAAARGAEAFQQAADEIFGAVINCMAHGPVCTFNTGPSVVTRCSEDYRLGDTPSAKRHLYHSYANMAYFGPTMWGDHDMFHSSDPAAARMMAVSRALSGGPVYLSDDPADFAPEHVLPLCDGRGRLYRPLAPAAAAPEDLFIDPLDEPVAFRALAPLPGGAVAVAVYNLTEPERPVVTSVTPKHYMDASALLADPSAWAPRREGLIVWDAYRRLARRLDERYAVSLGAFGDRLLLLCPIRCGWAVIGRPDKFLSPAAVEVVSVSPDRIDIRPDEPGAVVLWLASGRPVAGDAPCGPLAHGAWRIDLTAFPGGEPVAIRRIQA